MRHRPRHSLISSVRISPKFPVVKFLTNKILDTHTIPCHNNLQMTQTRIRKIRHAMRYSIAEFAELLGLKKPTYQGYDEGSRPTPKHVLKNAQEAQKREVKFFTELPQRVDENLPPGGCPNAAQGW